MIFILRICDVSIATLRLLSMLRGRKMVTVVLGFFEILIWIIVVGTVVRHLGSPILVISYAAGFAAGTYVGMVLEERLALGLAEVRVVSRGGAAGIASALRDLGFGVTEASGRGREGPVEMLTSVVQRRELDRLIEEVRHRDPEAFITVDEPVRIERGWLMSRRRK